jgi:hypothetical protein
VGYSCGPDPTKGCEGDADMALDEVWLHKELDSATADCLDILIADQGNSARSHADDQNLEGTGWGLRIVQLDAPPNGISIGGNAWLELTVSSVSAADYAERATALPERSKDMPTKFLGPTDIDPASITAPPEATNVVEEMVLISTTDDMMQWIIALTDDQVYHHYATYWGLHGQTVLTVKLNGGETT